jgi:ribosomal protein S20
MPIIKSAIKRVKQDQHRRARNRYQKDELRNNLKAFNAAVVGGEKAEIANELIKAQSQIDKMVKKNILHKNTAARRIQGLVKQAKEAGANPPAAKAKTTKTTKPAATKKTAPAKKPAAKTATKPAAKKVAAKKAVAKKPAAKKATTKK